MSVENFAKLAPQLDRHLLLPVLDFLQANGVDTAAAKKKLVTGTALFDLSKKANAGDAEALKAIEANETAHAATVAKLTKASGNILSEFFVDEDGVFRLKWTQRELEEEKKQGKLVASELNAQFKISHSNINAVYELGHTLYEAGSYDQAADILSFYNAISGKKSDAPETSALWGKLVCDTVAGNYDAAMTDIDALRSLLDAPSTTTTSRSWLLHHSLFAYFKRVGATQTFLDHVIDFATYTYANTIEVAAPHLIRYLSAAAVLNRKKRSILKRVTKIVEQEAYAYTDCFADFLTALADSNFAQANECIKKFGAACDGDFFLKDHKDDLIDCARMMVYDDYLKVHRVVSITAVAEQLGMDVEKAEVWLVTLIQEAKIDAEIDSVSKKIHVIPAAAHKTIHRDVINRLESIARPTN